MFQGFKTSIRILKTAVLFIAFLHYICPAQTNLPSGRVQWLRINSIHTYFSEQGCEVERGGPNPNNIMFSWPAEYGLEQSTMRSAGIWLGCLDYHDLKADRTFPYRVINIGPKLNEYEERPVFNAHRFELAGNCKRPTVNVNHDPCELLSFCDTLDLFDPELPADRILTIENHTAIGVTIKKSILAFTHQDHQNYLIYDFVLKNTGVIDNEGTVNRQTIHDFVFALIHRYAFAGESVTDGVVSWGMNNSTWGRNVIYDVLGTDPGDPDFQYRANLACYGPHSQRPVPDDWGCPDQITSGILAAAKYAGTVVLHTDTSPGDTADDPYQPATTRYVNADAPELGRAESKYDESMMMNRYHMMTQGHADLTHAQEVGDGFADIWGPGVGGSAAFMGFGPYAELAPGDSIHIVLAQGVAGLSREKNREVGFNWLLWNDGLGAPELMMPDGSTTTDHNLYKRSWVQTSRDSLLKTFLIALENYNNNYQPHHPPPPSVFNVTLEEQGIRLTWSDNAVTFPNFDGYEIWRAEGSILDPATAYTKIFECDGQALTHQYLDETAVYGFDYYYAIQSKYDGSLNNGTPLRSGLLWTLTTQPANLVWVAADRWHASISSFQLEQNFPNPFNASTTFRFVTPKAGFVSMQVLDILGRPIEILRAEEYPAGPHRVVWQPDELPSGIYIVSLRLGDLIEMRKISYVK